MKGIDIAEKFIGKHERRDTAELRAFFKKYSVDNDIYINPALIPWCAAFVNACERAVGNKGTGKLNARSFLQYGTPVDIKDAQRGDICIFKRGASAWEGHVSYYNEKISVQFLRCIGGNQMNEVNIRNYPKDHLLGIRRPPIK